MALLNKHYGDNKVSLATIIKGALMDPDKDGTCTGMSLVHVKGGEGGSLFDEIHSVKIGSNPVNEEQLAQTFKYKAETYSQDLMGVQSFVIMAFYGGRSEPEFKHPFRVNGSTEFNGLATEGPSAQGQTQQGMRLLEALVQGAFRKDAFTYDATMRVLQSVVNLNQNLMIQQESQFNMLRELLMEKAKQDHEYRLKEQDRALVHKLANYIPPLANSILGEEVFPQATADSAIFEALAEEITQEDLIKLSAAFPKNVWPTVAQRLTEILKRKAAEKAASSNGHMS